MRVSSRDGVGMTNGDKVNSGAAAGSKPGRWIGDISAERVDSVWRPEDHEAVIHNLQASDRLATRPEFRWPAATDLWVPLGLPSDAYNTGNRFNENYDAVVRLKPGVTFQQASASMQILDRKSV